MLYVLRFIGDVLSMLYCFTFYWWRFVFIKWLCIFLILIGL